MEERAPKKEFRCAFTGKETRFSMVFVIGNPPLRVSKFSGFKAGAGFRILRSL